jgi:hypothetical protein
MTAITKHTLDVLAATTERAVELIRNRPSMSNSVGSVRIECGHDPILKKLVIAHLRPAGIGGVDEKKIAGDLISWIYLLNNPRTQIYGQHHGNVEVVGELDGITYEVFSGHFQSNTKQYLRSLPTVTVHSLRRIQIGDVPEVVAA